MSYEWKLNECDANGIPYVKKAPVVLEKDGVKHTFTTQEEVDAAWDDGWHDTGRPETAEPAVDEPINLERMTKSELVHYGEEIGLELDMDMTKDQMLLFIASHEGE